MEDSTPTTLGPDSDEPRHCPDCGARVANLATSCLMCGTPLDGTENVPEEVSQTRVAIPWRGLLAGIFTALAFISLVGWLVRSQIERQPGTPTPTPTATLRPTRTPRPTETPLPTPTFTPVPPRAHQVQSGETCVSVATTYGVSLEVLVELNSEKCGPGGIIRPSDLLLIPAATTIPGPTPTTGVGTPSPMPECPLLHIVQRGDTGLGIAKTYAVPFNLIKAANPLVDFSQLPVNQVLQIPCREAGPTPTPTPDPDASPTPVPKYSAPVLLSPPDRAALTGALVPLQWTAVSLLRYDEFYVVRLRRLDESVPAESIYTRTTLVRLGEAYAPSPDAPELEYSWEVTVVRLVGTSPTGQPRYTAASELSKRRTFRWSFSPVDATPGVTTAP